MNKRIRLNRRQFLRNLAGKKSVADTERTLREELESWMIREHDFLPLPPHALQNTK